MTAEWPWRSSWTSWNPHCLLRKTEVAARTVSLPGEDSRSEYKENAPSEALRFGRCSRETDIRSITQDLPRKMPGGHTFKRKVSGFHLRPSIHTGWERSLWSEKWAVGKSTEIQKAKGLCGKVPEAWVWEVAVNSWCPSQEAGSQIRSLPRRYLERIGDFRLGFGVIRLVPI